MRFDGISIPELGIRVGEDTVNTVVKGGALAAGAYYAWPWISGAGAGGAGAAAGAAGGSSALSSWAPYIGAGLSYLGGQEANRANAEMAGQQMRFQQMMSSTAHQREVADLKAAGLNPILSANAGASSPSGASANMQNTLQGAVTSAMEIKQMQLAAAKQKEEIELLRAQRNKTDAEAKATKIGLTSKFLGTDAGGAIQQGLKKMIESTKTSVPKVSIPDKIKKHLLQIK